MGKGSKKYCKCHHKLRNKCHIKRTDCREVAEIVEALTIDVTEEQNRKRIRKKPKLRQSKHVFVPKHYKDTCVPMTPSMHTRLRYIEHCPAQPFKSHRTSRTSEAYDFTSEEDLSTGFSGKRKRKKAPKKKVRYCDLMPGDIRLPKPAPVIKHTESDKSIINMPSPKTSGEVIQAQRTSVEYSQVKPPLPPKSGYKLHKPHSGVYINSEKYYAASDVDTDRGRSTVISTKKRVCGGKCRHRSSKYNKKNICRNLRRHRRYRDDPYYASLGVEGKGPKGRSTQKYLRDDDSACGLDEIPKPEHVRIPPDLKRGTLQTHSLTVIPCTKDRKSDTHYGILCGSFNMFDNKFGPRSRGRQAVTLSAMAYCLAFHYHPKQWTMKLIDNLVDAGDKWYLQCLDKVHDHSSVQGICEVLQFGKKQTLILNGKRMQILLGEPDIVGYTMSLDPTVYNLCRGMKVFFKDNRAAILLTRVLKIVIWKDRICYYIFDPAGRDPRAYSDFSRGCAALVNVKNLEDVAEIVLARSIVEDQRFVLAPIKVLKMIDEQEDDDLESDRELTLAEKAMMGYRILNENCAIVNANMHLGDRCFEDAKNHQALPIAVVAMTYAKISPPNSWHTKTLDKILRLGNKLYVDCLHPKVMIDMTIDNIPNDITIGPYACEIIIYRERIKGQLFTQKECLFNVRLGLEEFFSKEYNSGIIHFNNYCLAVWRQKDMFYLFDPYPRTADGLRSVNEGKACVFMLLNPDAIADVFEKNWNYMPATTQFYVHAFKVLKLKKRESKLQEIVCSLSDEQLVSRKSGKRKTLPVCQDHGDRKEIFHEVYPMQTKDEKPEGGLQVDEEQMGDIVSLVDSIQEDFLPPIPLRYKTGAPERYEDRVVNLDSPTVSVTQVVPRWPKPRDKTNETPDPDPEPDPEPEPEPVKMPPPEGAEEEEEEVEGEEEDEDDRKRKKEEEEKRRKEEEEKKKELDLPPPLPPPPPSPQAEPELAPVRLMEDEVQTLPVENVDRRILLTEDAKYRHKLRQMRKTITPPLAEVQLDLTPSEELGKPSNFKQLPDSSQIIKGSNAITDESAIEVLPFVAIMAIVTSYKYSVNTWTVGIVNFVLEAAKKLHGNKQEKFQLAPVHVIPKIAIGRQAYKAHVDVCGEGATWQLEDSLSYYFMKYDRAIVTTPKYSCALFMRNNLYYLFDGSACNALGLRDANNKGKAAFMRFRSLRALVNRLLFNKDGADEEQFILSHVVVRRLLKDARQKLPEDYDYATRSTTSKKSRPSIVNEKRNSLIDAPETKSKTVIGYQFIEGQYRLEGTTCLKSCPVPGKGSGEVKSCHFVCLLAMFMATIHPIKTWDHLMVDTVMEKGLEIHKKATNLNTCDKRVIKNITLEGKLININIKKLIVLNENQEKKMEQYVKAVLTRVRYVIITFPQCSMVVCQSDGYFHFFDPYASSDKSGETPDCCIKKDSKKTDKKDQKKVQSVASWTRYNSMNAVINRIKKTAKGDHPDFYTFELTSVKTAPHSAMDYKLSPLYKPDSNPNMPYLRRKRARPLADEKMYWLNIETVPWSRMNSQNDAGLDRDTPRTVWKDWDIEFPGDLFSLWGTVHPMDVRFDEKHRGKQVLAVSTVALVITQCCQFSAWTSDVLDGIVISGNKYHEKSVSKLSNKTNYEMTVEDLDTNYSDMYPYSFSAKFEKFVFGFVYNLYADRFNLAKALEYFFEQHNQGLLISPIKNLAFGRNYGSYFMFDCQSYGGPVFIPGQGASYMLKCENLNRLIYCMTLTLNIRKHGAEFHLYNVNITVSEK